MNNTEAGVILTGKKKQISVNRYNDNEFNRLKLENELLKADKNLKEIAMAQMSKEICDLNNELQDILEILGQLKEMQ